MGVQKHSQGPHNSPTDCTMCDSMTHTMKNKMVRNSSTRPQVSDTDSDGV